MTTKQLAGIFPALASPCDEQDAFLEDTFVRLAMDLYTEGAHGLYVCGGTGDGFKMRLEERKRAAVLPADLSRRYGRSLIVHVGALSTRCRDFGGTRGRGRSACYLQYAADRCKSRGVNWVLQRPGRRDQSARPNLSLPQPVSSGAHVRSVAAAPRYPGRVGLKLSDWNLFVLKRLRYARPELIVFNGFDEFVYPGLCYGARGGIGTWYNLFPEVLVGIYQAFREGNHARALALQDALTRFIDLAAGYNMIAVFEFLMQRRGYGPRCFRRPTEPLDHQALAALEPQLDACVRAMQQVVENGAVPPRTPR